MRNQLLKLKKPNSTKGERQIGEILKRNKIKFKTKWKIGGREADFVCGRLIIEVDGNIHKETDAAKDTYFASKGFVTIHINPIGKDMGQLEKDIKYLIKANNLFQEKKWRVPIRSLSHPLDGWN